MVKISIITVCFNSEETINRTIKSVKDQKYKNLEYIIIDGGSTDKTLEIIKQNKNLVSCLISEPDYGLYHAMNKGIALSTGEIVGFLNSDDVYVHSNILEQIGNLFKRKKIEACYGDIYYTTKFDRNNVKRYWKSDCFSKGSFSKGWTPPHPSFFAKKEMYEKYGDFDLLFPIAADFDLMLRFLEKHNLNVYYINSPIVNMSTGGISDRGICSVFKQNLEILKILKKNGISFNIYSFFLNKIISRFHQLTYKFKKNFNINYFYNKKPM